MVEVPDHVYVFYTYRLYFADKDIYMIRYFYHKIEIIRVLFFRSYLHNMKMAPTPLCSCPEKIEQTARHLMIECSLFSKDRPAVLHVLLVGPEAARLLRSWVRIPPGAWIFVCCECRVLSGRGLCDDLITRPEESYRLCCVVVCDLETSRMGATYIYIYIYIYIYLYIYIYI